MRTALVGIKPADQVMLKGYLRVLLRLEADLEWVSANHPQVDLYMINYDFKQADNIVKLLNSHPNTPVLYVTRSSSSNGHIEGDLLSLPLKKTEVLNEWLFHNISMLTAKGTASKRRFSSNKQDISKPTTVKSQSHLSSSPSQQNTTQPRHTTQHHRTTQPRATDTAQPRHTIQRTQVKQPTPASTHSPVTKTKKQQDYAPLIEVIQQLQKGEGGFYHLYSKESLLATLEPSNSLVWADEKGLSVLKANGLTSLRLQLISGQPQTLAEASDMRQWLWSIAWQQIEDIVPLVNQESLYQLRFWVKPTSAKERRDLLRVMVAMEKISSSIEQIAENAGSSEDYVRKVIAGLLFSGFLPQNVYQEIRADERVLGASPVENNEPNANAQSETSKQEPRTLDSVLSRRAAGEQASVPTSSAIPSSVIQKSSGSKSTSVDDKTAETTKPPVESQKSKPKTEKQGFLARLRRKLGL